MPVQEGDIVCLKCGGVNGHRPGCSGEKDQEFEVIAFYGARRLSMTACWWIALSPHLTN
jgi:hypothetical protein